MVFFFVSLLNFQTSVIEFFCLHFINILWYILFHVLLYNNFVIFCVHYFQLMFWSEVLLLLIYRWYRHWSFLITFLRVFIAAFVRCIWHLVNGLNKFSRVSWTVYLSYPVSIAITAFQLIHSMVIFMCTIYIERVVFFVCLFVFFSGLINQPIDHNFFGFYYSQ